MSRQRLTWIAVHPHNPHGNYPAPPEGGWNVSKPHPAGWWFEGDPEPPPPAEKPGEVAYFVARLIG